MEPFLKDAFERNRIVDIAANCYGVTSEELSFIGGFQNFVYEYRHDGNFYILRMTPGSRRTVGLVLAELEWIQYLTNNGVSASKPIRSGNGLWAEVIKISDADFIAVSFEKAPGRKIDYPECLHDNALYEKLGQVTGKMHALSKLYKPKIYKFQRNDWHLNFYMQQIDILPSTHSLIKENYYKWIDTINQLPKDAESYGLIHGDIGIGNFLLDEHGTITLFDFDEAQYSWFIEDIAVQLYYLVYVYGGGDGLAKREEQANRFMHFFMKGYHSENKLSEFWLKQIPLFLMLRELIVYIGAFRQYDGDETFSKSDNQWFKDWIAESRARLENNIPIVDVW